MGDEKIDLGKKTEPVVKFEDGGKYGRIDYIDMPRGFVKIVNDFEVKYLTKIQLPITGKLVRCHREMAVPLLKVLTEIVKRCQYDSDYEYFYDLQIFCPRHQWYLSTKPLSRHTFALAIDGNPADNIPGTDGTMPEGIVDLFEENGFTWGGRWKKKDPMHFELRLTL